jgi:hypothetical protein
MRMPHHILTTRMKTLGFIKSSVQNNAVHMKLNLRQSFYYRRSLEGYKVGTITGFPVKIVEALAPQPRCSIPWKYPQ